MYLHFPRDVETDSYKKLWLAPGGIIDMDDPFVRECAAGQEYKLEAAPEGSTATPIDHTRFNSLRAAKIASVASQGQSQKSEPTEKTDPNIPSPDPRPKKSEERKHGALSGSVSQGHPR